MKQSTISAFFQVKNPQPKKYTSNTIVPEIVIYTDGVYKQWKTKCKSWLGYIYF